MLKKIDNIIVTIMKYVAFCLLTLAGIFVVVTVPLFGQFAVLSLAVVWWLNAYTERTKSKILDYPGLYIFLIMLIMSIITYIQYNYRDDIISIMLG